MSRTLRRLIVGGVAVVLGAMPLSAPTASAAAKPLDGPLPEDVSITVITGGGDASCPERTSVALAADATALSVRYSDLTARVGVGADPADASQRCSISLAIQAPGFTYGIARVEHLGDAYLAEGATGTLRAWFQYSDAVERHGVTRQLPGPMDGLWSVTQESDEGVVWAPCGSGMVDLTAELRVAAGTSDPLTTASWLTLGESHGDLGSTHHLAWRACDERGR